MADVTPTDNNCLNCNKSRADIGSLKQCSKCKSARYCSRDCQKANWKQHKKDCARLAQAAAETQPAGSNTSGSNTGTQALDFKMNKPFHQLHAKKWLHGRPETDVYKLLIDTYRLRMEDKYNLEGDVASDSIYSGVASGVPGFQRFLRLVEGKRELLPEWWSPAKSQACVAFASGQHNDYNVDHAVEKSDIVEQYGDPLMPMQLRMLGEQIYGSGPGGQPGAGMMQMQMLAEGSDGNMGMSNIDVSQLLRGGR
ncbi:MYND domain protein [Penicillium tannophilum]|nr:MYND domain protein [Penicillium tannophilum]